LFFTFSAQAAAQDDANNYGNHATNDNTYDHSNNFFFLVKLNYALFVHCHAELLVFVCGNRILFFSIGFGQIVITAVCQRVGFC